MGKELGDTVFIMQSGSTKTTTHPTLEQGGINSSGEAANPPSSNRVRTASYIRVTGRFDVFINTNYVFNVSFYTLENKTFEGNTGAWQESGYTSEYDGYIKVACKNDAGTDITPSNVTLQLDIYEASRVSRITLLEKDVYGLSEPTLEQGGLSDAQGGTPIPPSDANYARRVRSADYIYVDGLFTLEGNGNKQIFLYDTNKGYIGRAFDGFQSDAKLEVCHHGYIKLLLANADTTTNCSPSDFAETLSMTLDARMDMAEIRLDAMEEQVPIADNFTDTYIGELIKIGYNKFKSSAYKTLPQSLVQAMAIYNDFIILFDYNSSSAIAYIYKLSTATLLASLTLPNSTYKRPHCNSATFSEVFNTSDSILPLLYVSQWDNDSEKGCFVYDIKLINGTYSVDLVQTILPANVSTATLGAGQTDWCVDPLGYIYCIGYLLNNGATIETNNKTMITKFTLPKVSDGAVVTFGDADVIDHFDVPIYIYRQDAIFENSRILMLAGMTGNIDRRLLAIDPAAKQVVSVVSLDYINKEPEGIGIADGKLLIGFNGDNSLYHFAFI
ncbi:MAG: hypothetical protein IJ160_00110 [Muribaculaceae bacterium]|nr:hypothetical protein [Muribaculaceae bacterium]